MEFFKNVPHINFLAARRYALVLSSVLILATLVSLAVQGLHLGLDFTGGATVQLQFPKPTPLAPWRALLRARGFRGARVRYFGGKTSLLIRLRPERGVTLTALGQRVVALVRQHDPSVVVAGIEAVGPQVGGSLRIKGLEAMLGALILIVMYVAYRFEYRFALGAMAATVHDVLLTIGFFSLTRMTFNLDVLAAVLAIMGYSLNDTVVVFDRIREDFRKARRGTPIEIMDRAINETLSRTVMTALMTLLVVVALMIVGGPVLRGFSVALFVGILIGTYSSIFIASATALSLGVTRENLLPKPPPEAVDDRP